MVEGQVRGDYYSKTHPDWSARLTGMYALDKNKRHVVRLSGAKAYRAPLSNVRWGHFQQNLLPTPPFPANTYLFNFIKPLHKLKNEETASIELGYTGQFTNYLTFRTNAYFQRYDRLINYDAFTGLGLPNQIVSASNQDGGANAWGVENELELKGKPGSLSAWYSYNGFWPDNGPNAQNMRMGYMPAPHKVGITGRLNLPWDMVLNTDYRFTSAISPLFAAESLPITHHMNISLSKAVKFGRVEGEFMVGVNDVFHHRRGPVESVSDRTGYDTPGRTFFARFQIKF
jgi:outer membrane receptor protein involved in Fe transport